MPEQDEINITQRHCCRGWFLTLIAHAKSRDKTLSRQVHSNLGLKRPKQSGRVACDHRARRHILRHHAAGPDHRFLTNGYATEKCGSRTDGGASFYQGANAGPIRVGLQPPIVVGGARKTIVGESDIVTDENIVFQGHPFANEGVTRNFTAITDFDTFLNLNKSADFYIVPNFTTVEIREVVNTDIFSQLYVRSDSLTRCLQRFFHVGEFTARSRAVLSAISGRSEACAFWPPTGAPRPETPCRE